MASSEAKEVKSILTGLLISNPLKCTIKQLCIDFVNTVGYRLPYQKLGFQTVEEYLRSIPDTVRVYGSGSLAEVEGVVKPSSAHINEMVLRQKKDSIPKHKRTRIKRSSAPQPSTSNYPRYNRPPKPSYWGNNSKNFSNGSPWKSSMQSTSNNFCNQDTLNQNTSNNSDNGSSSSSYVNCPTPDSSSSREKDVDSCEIVEDSVRDDRSDISSDYNEYETRVPPKIQNNLKKLILKFPDGIACTKLPEEYNKMFNRKLRYEKYNYRSLIEMCSDLPEIFHYVQPNSLDFILYDKNKPIPSLNQNDMATAQWSRKEIVGGDVLSELSKLDWASSLAFIPPNVLHLSDRIPRHFPTDFREGDYLDICIGEIYDLSKFWIYLLFGELTSLMKELQEFYKANRNKYLIPEQLLAEGLYCTTLYGKEFHRCVIVNLLPDLPGAVRVLFVDYGTVSNVPSNEIWYLAKQFGKVPCQAIRAKLSNICPTHENRTWSVQAVRRFNELITRTALVAEIINVDKENYALEIYLADVTNEEDIFFINDKLVKEGYAVYPHQERKKTLVDPSCKPNVPDMHLYPEFWEIESGNAPSTQEMDYIVTRRVPLHHFMSQYFDVEYIEDVEQVERLHKEFNQSVPKVQIKPLPEFDLSKDFDYTLFPEEMLVELKDLVSQEVANLRAEAEQKVQEDMAKAKNKEKVKCKQHNDNVEQNKEQIESKTETSNELRSGERGDFSKDLSLDLSRDAAVPLNNTLNKLQNSTSDLAVINNVTKPSSKSTNPFLYDEAVGQDTNPFRITNPFLIEIEDKLTTSDLLEKYAKPLEKKVNNDIAANKPLNVDKPKPTNPFEPERARGVRTPPGFSSTPVTQPVLQSVPSWGPPPPSQMYHQSNPYYQRFPQFMNMYSFNMHQSGPMPTPHAYPPDYYNYMQYQQQFQFNMQYLQQALAAQNFMQQQPPQSSRMCNSGNYNRPRVDDKKQ